MTVENQPGSATEVTAQAAEGLLGHNPFIGLDPSDVFADSRPANARGHQHPCARGRARECAGRRAAVDLDRQGRDRTRERRQTFL